MAKRGRKPIVINWEEFEALCAIQPTLREMALFFNCSERTIERAVKKQYEANFVSVTHKRDCRDSYPSADRFGSSPCAEKSPC